MHLSLSPSRLKKKIVTSDVKKIRTYGYPWIKWILATRGYGYFCYSHVNGAGTGIIVSVPVDTRTRSTLIHKSTFIYIYIYISKKYSGLIFSKLHILSSVFILQTSSIGMLSCSKYTPLHSSLSFI